MGFFDAGLVEEVRILQGGIQPMSLAAAQGIGYREVIDMLAGQANLAETIDRIQTRSRQFAKRQATWFRGLEEVRSFPIAPEEDPEAIADPDDAENPQFEWAIDLPRCVRICYQSARLGMPPSWSALMCACVRDGSSIAVGSPCLEAASRILRILARVVSTGAVPKEGIDPWAGDSR